MITICPDFFTIGLEKQFRRLLKKQRHAKQLKQINPKLKVQAVDFRHWQSRCLGIMVTPWFMNLMLLPNEGDEWQDLPIGNKSAYHFPSGDYEFVLAEEEGIGRYQVHPVFAPMLDFDDQETAIKIAQQALLILMSEQASGSNSLQKLRHFLAV